MVFSLKEQAGGLEHAARGLHRALFRVSSTRYFDALLKKAEGRQPGQNTQSLRLVTDDSGKPVTCKGCGYAIVRIVYPDAWEVEACSAVTAPGLIDNKNFDQWVESIPRSRVTSEVR